MYVNAVVVMLLAGKSDSEMKKISVTNDFDLGHFYFRLLLSFFLILPYFSVTIYILYGCLYVMLPPHAKHP